MSGALLKKRKVFTVQKSLAAPVSNSIWRASDMRLISCDDGSELSLLSFAAFQLPFLLSHGVECIAVRLGSDISLFADVVSR